MYDIIYFAIGINYSLPMSGTLGELQDLINVNYYLRTVQIIHILSAKLLELIFIGFIISKITKLLEKIEMNSMSIIITGKVSTE